MRILPLNPNTKEYLRKRNLERKFTKQKALFEQNPFHPSLKTELLAPKALRIWSFRLDKKYRVIFIFHNSDSAEVVDINNHYK